MTDEEILEHAKRLQRAMDRIIGNPHKHCQEMATLKDAEIARLRAAIKPFADLARDWVRCANETGVSDECAIVRSVPSGINVGNCRALLKALGDK